MTMLDLLVIVLAIFAAVGGYKLGFVARIISWGGMALGLTVAVVAIPWVLEFIDGRSEAAQFLVASGLLIVGVFAGQAAGMMLGSKLRIAMPTRNGREADRWGGAAAGVVGVLLGLWLLLPGMRELPGWPAEQAEGSLITRRLDAFMPDPPNAIRVLRDAVGADRFPTVFTTEIEAPDKGPPPLEAGLTAATRDTSAVSVLKIESRACNRIHEGTGWVIGPDLVLTNAHVVAGEGAKTVTDSEGQTQSAILVGFDPQRDLALLLVADLGLPSLTKGQVEVGDTGGVLGHPGGRGLTLTPFRIDGRVTAVGRDLYDLEDTRRDVLFLGAQLEPGDSGAPLLNSQGEVLGSAFAISPENEEVAYALTLVEVDGFMAEVDATTEVSAGACLS
ncbi:MAG: MarP family serine protease [Acidimicrobiales bacterium]